MHTNQPNTQIQISGVENSRDYLTGCLNMKSLFHIVYDGHVVYSLIIALLLVAWSWLENYMERLLLEWLPNCL